ncbi:MAG TPA: imidazole glycerol phosphate synthase subunit HisH [Oculatellaceae cyanobacterium]|jgi:glutamine amidotransferase
MNKTVSIVDYGIGNLFSVSRAVEQCGGQPVLVTTPEEVLNAERLILPGVGAFADGMDGLRTRGLIDALKAYGQSNRPLLGICLGMQMLLEINEEFGIHNGLGLIPGRVCAIPSTDITGQKHKIPHIGWTALQKAPSQAQDWDDPLLCNIPENTKVYFVHSFTAFPTHDNHRLADAWYGGRQISAIIRKGRLYGCQFHPEKSGPWGLKILENFINLN